MSAIAPRTATTTDTSRSRQLYERLARRLEQIVRTDVRAPDDGGRGRVPVRVGTACSRMRPGSAPRRRCRGWRRTAVREAWRLMRTRRARRLARGRRRGSTAGGAELVERR